MYASTDFAYGLVHGGMHGGWCWDDLRPCLNAPSVAVDLPGRTGDETVLATITYQDWVESAVQQIIELGRQDIVLIGHSLAGIVLPQIAISLRDRIKAIVFIAAVVPAEGESFAAHMGYPVLGASWPPAAPDVARALLGTGMPDAMFNSLLPRLNAEPALPLKTRISRIGAPDVPSLYIRAINDATGLGAPEYERLRGTFSKMKMVEVPGGHNMMMTHPAALATAIHQFVGVL